MRISDWSADVCSSEFARRAVELVGLVGQVGEQATDRTRHHRVVQHGPEDVELRHGRGYRVILSELARLFFTEQLDSNFGLLHVTFPQTCGLIWRNTADPSTSGILPIPVVNLSNIR